MICPDCETDNPPRARRCVCGYQLVFDSELARDRGPKLSGLAAVFIAVGIAIIALSAWLTTSAIEGSNNPPDPVLGLLLIPMGAFASAGGIANWNWFMLNRRARLFVALFGRTGARVIYAVLGAALAGAGIGILAAPAGPGGF